MAVTLLSGGNNMEINEYLFEKSPYNIIRENFPDYYIILLDDLKITVHEKRLSEIQVSSLLAQALQKFRQHNASLAFQMPDILTQEIIANTIDNAEYFRSMNINHCSIFLSKGAAGLIGITEIPQARILESSELVVNALALAKNNNQNNVGMATDDDWDQIFIENSIELTEEELEAITTQNVNHPSYCESSIKFMRFINDASGEYTRRIRASFLHEMLKG
jgi:hypothetical protein